MCSHRLWGGNLGGQHGPRGLVGDGQPTGVTAVGQRDVLHRIDLPGRVRLGRPRNRDDQTPPPPGAIDAVADEGGLEAADGGDVAAGAPPPKLEANEAGAPGGMLSLQFAGIVEELKGLGRCGSPAGVVAKSQALDTVSAVGPPDRTDRIIGEGKLGGDRGQWTPLEEEPNDVVSDRERDGAWHEQNPRREEGRFQSFG